ncbi:MAG: hypothetical protein HQK79_00130 [Desulfobacterales bacterium]|nr:hypothetical protein [Desulfobacterales bacterium]MBF0395384.1 hypothetical protein [Desulfobacterales bacterium]
MKLKEKIYNSVKKMNIDELTLLYEYIRLLNQMKQVVNKKAEDISIEQILEMTSSSKSCWSDTVIQERAEYL